MRAKLGIFVLTAATVGLLLAAESSTKPPAKSAAPVAANVILKARELGLLGDQYKPKTPAAKQPSAKKKKR